MLIYIFNIEMMIQSMHHSAGDDKHTPLYWSPISFSPLPSSHNHIPPHPPALHACCSTQGNRWNHHQYLVAAWADDTQARAAVLQIIEYMKVYIVGGDYQKGCIFVKEFRYKDKLSVFDRKFLFIFIALRIMIAFSSKRIIMNKYTNYHQLYQ